MSNLLARWKGRGLKNRLLHPHDALWDNRLGIQTFGYVPAVGEVADAHWQGHYQPTSYRDILAMLRHVGVGPGDHYVDLGCGLGRTVFVANWLGADRAVGVEIDARLASQCRDSAQRRRHVAGAVEFLCAPAQTYLHPDTTVLFMFHPFGAGTLREVIEQIDDSVSRRPRRLRLVYFNPVFDEVLHTSRHLRPSEHWPQPPDAASHGGDYAVSFWAAAA